MEKGESGFQIVRILLEAIPGETIHDLTKETSGHEATNGGIQEDCQNYDASDPEYELTQRLVRSSKEIIFVKELYENQCQICGYGIKTPAGLYSEGAHIVPVGFPHHGTDHRSNILCLCADDHVAFDRGTYVIEDDFTIWDTVDTTEIGTLHTHPHHDLSLENIRNHRRRFKFS